VKPEANRQPNQPPTVRYSSCPPNIRRPTGLARKLL
jgi:hypothetical protein